MSSALLTVEQLPSARDLPHERSHSEKRASESRSIDSYPDDKEKNVIDPGREDVVSDSGDDSWYEKRKPLVNRLLLVGLAALILGWWISATILPATRHRWIVQTIFAWFFLLVIAFRFIPNSVVTRPVEAVWVPLVQKPFFALPYYVRLTMGWLALLAVVFGSAFGFKLEGVRHLISFNVLTSLNPIFMFIEHDLW